MAKVTVLRGFAYGGKQGTRESTVWLKPGDEVEILDDLVAGLVKEGFIKTPPFEKAATKMRPARRSEG